jgi:phosphopantothenoylcysteine synthetase/decarboxylase
MNTLMYEHPLTAEHLRIVRDVVGYHVVGPIGKNLACGDVGQYHLVTVRFDSVRSHRHQGLAQ